MNWYKRHLGDWSKDTSHLSILESGAYDRLIAVYYRNEKPLTLDIAQLCKLAGCKTPQDRNAVKSVLKEFFREQSDGYHQARCDREIADYQVKSEKASKSALTRWTKPNHANASGTQCIGNASLEPRTNKDLVVENPTRTGPAKLQNLLEKINGHEPQTKTKNTEPIKDNFTTEEHNRKIAELVAQGRNDEAKALQATGTSTKP